MAGSHAKNSGASRRAAPDASAVAEATTGTWSQVAARKDFLAGVISVLNVTGLDPHYLELEMTESGLMQDTEPTTAILNALKKLGVQIAIDDFGTGYSSLSYLLRFSIDTLKIDQSFVQDLDGPAARGHWGG